MNPIKNTNTPLSDLGRIKNELKSLLFLDDKIVQLIMPVLDEPACTREANWYGGPAEKLQDGETVIVPLTGHCFDMPYIAGAFTDKRAAVFVESTVPRMINSQVKEVQIAITVLCDREMAALSAEDAALFQTLGIYGNRVDCACQAIDLCLQASAKGREWSIGNICPAEEMPVSLFLPESRYYGKVLSYTCQTYYRTGRSERQQP